MEASGAFRDTNRWKQLLDVYACCAVIDRSRAALLENARLKAAAIGATDIDGATLDGPAIGQAIREKRRQAIEQVVAGAQS
jgi:hypothetical protein